MTQPRWWGHRFCGAYLEELVQGQWFWIGWHDLERAEGQCSSRGDALAALDHFLDGRRGAGRAIARHANALVSAELDLETPVALRCAAQGNPAPKEPPT